jgi:Na+/melibiose symporter-like transporter
MTALWKLLGWPRALLLAVTLVLIVVPLLFEVPAVFGPEDQALHDAVILGSWIFLGVVILVVLIALIAVLWMNSVVKRNVTRTLARLEHVEMRWSSPAAKRARQSLRARSRQ